MALKSTHHIINEYQGYIMGSKGGWCLGLKTVCRLSINSGSLNIMSPEGPVKACIWIAYFYSNLHLHGSENLKSRRTKDVDNKEPR
jgi:hypothetical protein